MQCKKCQNAAVVHLTEIVPDASGKKRPMEIHLCLQHAVEGGYVPQGTQVKEKPANVEPVKPVSTVHKPTHIPPPTAIVPVPQTPPGALARKDPNHPDAHACPQCGLTWGQFKQSGVMGCPNDYIFFATRLLPLIKRAHESGSEHHGKVPRQLRQSDQLRGHMVTRLRRELEMALEAENYERAAKLRDQIRQIG